MNKRGNYFYKILSNNNDYSKINISNKFNIFLSNIDLWILEKYRIGYTVTSISASKGSGDNYIRKPIQHLIIPFKKGKVIDHINGKVYDNRRDNLRICSHKENMQNSKKRKHSKNLYKGIRQVPSGKYITIFGQTTKGTYGTPELAAKIYDIHAIKHFKEYARPNFNLTQKEQEQFWDIFNQRKNDLKGKGMHFRKDTKKWQVKIKVGLKKYKHLGCFNTKKEAEKAINYAEVEDE